MLQWRWRTSAAWWPALLQLLVDWPQVLHAETYTDAYRPDFTSNEEGVGVPPWDSIAVLLSGGVQHRQNFLLQLCALEPLPGDRARIAHALRHGAVSSAMLQFA